MRRYHINPKTGVPSICRAQNSKCPYGGESGEANHYKTYGEAQKKSQEFFEKIYNILPGGIPNGNSEEIMNEIEQKMKVKHEAAERLKSSTQYELTKELITTKDESLIVGVIQGEVLKDSGWSAAGAALQNPNIPKALLNDILYDFPDGYDTHTRQWATLNRSLTHEQLKSIIEDESEDIDVRAIAFRNPNLDSSYVKDIIDKDKKKLESLPYTMIMFSEHSTPEINYMKEEAMIMRTDAYDAVARSMSNALNFVPWHLAYKKDIERENGK